jgi:cutinase
MIVIGAAMIGDDTSCWLSQSSVPVRWTSMNTTSARLLGLSATMLGALPLMLGALPTANAAPCPDVEVVFARGTTEPPGVGGIGQAFVDSLRAKAGSRSVGVYAVDYPASNDFVTSTPAGANDASAHIQAMARNCPATRMVLGGYSQGAAVIDIATNAMPPAVADHVAADALFGAPRTTFADSLAPGPSPVTGPLYVGKTVAECVQNDPICWESGWDMRAHTAYVQTGMVDQAADYAAGRL